MKDPRREADIVSYDATAFPESPREHRHSRGDSLQSRLKNGSRPERGQTMSELSHTATVNAATGDHPLVNGLRQRHAELSARDGRAKPFELRLSDRTAYQIGDAGEPAFTVQIVTEKGLAALAAFDELAVAEAYMDGDLDIEGDLLTALKLP